MKFLFAVLLFATPLQDGTTEQTMVPTTQPCCERPEWEEPSQPPTLEHFDHAGRDTTETSVFACSEDPELCTEDSVEAESIAPPAVPVPHAVVSYTG